MSQGYIDPNLPNPHGPDDASIIIYGYTPSTPLSILGITLFAALLLTSSFQVLRSHLWSYTPIILGCTLEVTGYIFRYLSSHVDPYRITFFIVQYFCITVAPVFSSASIYVYLSHLTHHASAHKYNTGLVSRFGHRRILWIFVSADVLCTLLQVTGASLIGVKTSKHKDPASANNILMAGLAAQTLAFSIFMVLACSLALAMTSNARRRSYHVDMTLKKGTFTLCFAGTLIFVRTVFRLCESAQGVFGDLSSHEVFFGTLEFAPVVVGVGLLLCWTPAMLRTRDTAGVVAVGDEN